MSDLLQLDFGDGRYTFFLPMQRIMEIERACGDKSIATMHEEMGASLGIEAATEQARFLGGGPVRIKDVYEIIRCAAIGGGEAEVAGETVKVSPNDATRLVREYVDGRPYSETVPVAWAILDRTLMGVRLKKKADDPAPQSLSEKAT